jgi:hypothetical protein
MEVWREIDHSPPSSVEVKKGGAILPLPHVFMTQFLIKHKDNSAFTFYHLWWKTWKILKETQMYTI